MAMYYGDNQDKARKVVVTGIPGPQGPAGPQGQGVPAGGTSGQVLAKSTDADYQTEWVNQPEGLPAGGTTGQVVTKTDSGAEWADAPTGNWELVQDLPYFQFFKNGNTIAVYFKQMNSGFFTAEPSTTTVNGISYKRWFRLFNLNTGLNPDYSPSAGETIPYTNSSSGTNWYIRVVGGRENFAIQVTAIQPYIGNEPTDTPSLGSTSIQIAMYPINRQ